MSEASTPRTGYPDGIAAPKSAVNRTNLRELTAVPGLERFGADAVGYCGPEGCVVPDTETTSAEVRGASLGQG
ncbi:hypothetical protein GCM10023169_33590 [Georgenia halophila]|uniref:Uncharacterized protein n=1 Tax=Georgenia halophila TaxID=620889 RepID=A0ABP8LJP0_9MICO